MGLLNSKKWINEVAANILLALPRHFVITVYFRTEGYGAKFRDDDGKMCIEDNLGTVRSIGVKIDDKIEKMFPIVDSLTNDAEIDRLRDWANDIKNTYCSSEVPAQKPEKVVAEIDPDGWSPMTLQPTDADVDLFNEVLAVDKIGKKHVVDITLGIDDDYGTPLWFDGYVYFTPVAWRPLEKYNGK